MERVSKRVNMSALWGNPLVNLFSIKAWNPTSRPSTYRAEILQEGRLMGFKNDKEKKTHLVSLVRKLAKKYRIGERVFSVSLMTYEYCLITDIWVNLDGSLNKIEWRRYEYSDAEEKSKKKSLGLGVL